MHQTSRFYPFAMDKIWLLIICLTAFRLVFIGFAPVTEQEVYYWLYSQNLDYSYVDHPPMVGISIFLGTYLFGDNGFGIKFMAVVWSLLTNTLLYITARRAASELSELESKDIAFTAVVLYNLALFVHLFAIIQQPDSALLFFWLAVLYFIQEFQITRRSRNFIYAGVALGLGLLTKYTVVAILPGIFIALLLNPRTRRSLLTVYPYLAVIIAFILFSPVIYWNYQHEWISFDMQFSQRGQKATSPNSLHYRYLLQLIGTQLAMLSPLLFVLFIKCCSRLASQWRRYSAVHLYFLSGAFLILGFTLISLTSKVKLHWLLPGYLGIILAIAFMFKEFLLSKSKWVSRGAWFSIILIVLCHGLLAFPGFQVFQVNSWSGWKHFTGQVLDLQDSLGGQKNVFIFTNSHKTAAYITFYSPDHQRTYAHNAIGVFAKQFDVWGVPENLRGKTGIYVSSRPKLNPAEKVLVARYFDKVSFARKFSYSLFSVGDKPTRDIYCYIGTNYSLDPK